MRVLRALIAVAISVTSLDVIAAGPGQTALSASIFGTASDTTGHVLSSTAVQLRSVSTGRLIGSATTNDTGQFCFLSLSPGTYLVEVLSSAGHIVGTSGTIMVSAGAVVTDVSVTASSIKASAPGADDDRHAAVMIVGAAVAAGVAGGIAMTSGGTASPSQ